VRDEQVVEHPVERRRVLATAPLQRALVVLRHLQHRVVQCGVVDIGEEDDPGAPRRAARRGRSHEQQAERAQRGLADAVDTAA